MADVGFTKVIWTVTLAEGEMFAELFRREGIAAHFPSVNAAMVGIPPHVFELSIEVPAESEERARELLSELTYLGANAEAETAAETAGETYAEPPPPAAIPRRPILAAGVAFRMPGGGHFHARRPWTGLLIGTVLFGGWLVSFTLVNVKATFASEMLFGALIALVFADSIGGARAAREENRGIHTSQSRQFARGFVLLACAAVVGAMFATVAATPRWLLARTWGRFETSCTPAALRVSNGDREGRILTVSNLVVCAETSGFPTAYRLGPDTWAQLDLSPGASGSIDFSLPDELRERCIASGCVLRFSVEANRPRDLAIHRLSGEGSCVPWWDQPGGAWPGRIQPAAAE